jgi:hypothetical protein
LGNARYVHGYTYISAHRNWQIEAALWIWPVSSSVVPDGWVLGQFLAILRFLLLGSRNWLGWQVLYACALWFLETMLAGWNAGSPVLECWHYFPA